MSIEFDSPIVNGGQTPITTTCTKISGTQFPLGSTNVTCTAIDARHRSASCAFQVTIEKVAHLGVSRLVAFGDSITEGVVSTCDRITPFMTLIQSMLVMPRSAGNDSWTYPSVLQNLIRSRYLGESPVVTNRGSGGEELAAGALRLPSVLLGDRPEMLLLQEGANDVVQGHTPVTIANSLRDMVKQARSRGMEVLIGTLLPQNLSPCRPYLNPDSVPPVNDGIRAIATSENIPLVDLYRAFESMPHVLIGIDGLHPTEAGYRKIAETFLDVMKQREQ